MARPPLDHLRVFAAAARALSFQAAAAELHLTPSAVSQRIRTLEGMLATPLFRRLTRRVILTEAGERLWQRVRAPLAEVEAALSDLVDPADRPVTVSTTASFAQSCLLPALARFQIAHPQVRVKILVDNALANVAGREVDIGIRQGTGPYPGLQAEPLFAGQYIPVASPALAARPRSAPLIEVVWPPGIADPPLWPAWQAHTGIRLDGPVALTVPLESVAIQAAIAGQGMALVHHRFVAAELERGTLVSPFGQGAILPTRLRHHAVRATGPTRPASEALWHWLCATFA